MDFDQDLADLLTASVKNLAPPVADIVAESSRIGREHRRTRRLRTLRTAGAVLAVGAVVCAGGALAAATHGDSVPAAPQPAGPAPALTGPAAPQPSASAPPAGTPLTADAMVKLLADRLPPGGTFTKYQQPNGDHDPSGEVGAFLRYDDGHGTATFQLALRKETRPFPTGPTPGIRETPLRCDLGPQRPSGPPPGPISCETRRLPDGSWELTRATDTLATGLYGYQVLIWRPNGDFLALNEYAGTVNPYGHAEAVTRPAPPVPLDQWRALAESPAWQYEVPRALVDEAAAFTAHIPRAPFPEG